MNKKLITALIIAFIAVKNPVNLVKATAAYAEAKKIKANAVSEADIAKRIESLYQRESYLTVEQKAKIQIEAYNMALKQEKLKKLKAEESRFLAESVNFVARLRAAGLSATFINNYLRAEKIYNVPWELIAAVHYTETGQRGDTLVSSYAGAQGPMQFMPSTFRAYAQDGDGNGIASINDVDDAIYTGAKYLAANGANRGNYVSALFRYNHDYGYVYHVLSIAQSIGLK